MKRSLFLTFLTSAATWVGTACGNDTTTSDTSGDTIVDASDGVDSAGDATSTGDATADSGSDDTGTATDSVAPTDTGTATDATTTPDADTVEPVINIVINEVSVAGTDPDWLELYNGGNVAVDIGGYTLRDDDPLHGYVFPASTIIAPGAYYALDEDPTGAAGFDFGFGDIDGAYLSDRSDVVVDETTWDAGDAPVGATWGRYPNGSGAFGTLYNPTKGTANVENPAETCGNNVREGGELCDGTDLPDGIACTNWGFGGGTVGCPTCDAYVLSACTPHAAALVVNEVTSEGIDMIELYNGTAATIALLGYQVLDSADHTFTFGARSISAGGYVVLEKDVDFTFGLASDDLVKLLDKNGNVVDVADWAAGEAAPSYCRSPNGTGGFHTCATASFGSANP